jgi:hypothetical protein
MGNLHLLLNISSRNALYGFLEAGVASINSLSAEYMCLERPIMLGVSRKFPHFKGFVGNSQTTWTQKLPFGFDFVLLEVRWCCVIFQLQTNGDRP